MFHRRLLIVGALLAVVWSTPSFAQPGGGVTAKMQGRFLNVKGTPGGDVILIFHTGQQVVLLASDANRVVTQRGPGVRHRYSTF